MKKLVVICLTVLAIALTCGFLAKHHAASLKNRETKYQESLTTYTAGVNRFKQGELDQAAEQFQLLANDPQFEPQMKMYSGLVAYRQAESLYERYVKISNTRSQEAMPESKEILAGYQKFEELADSLLARPEFSDPAIQWRLYNDIGTAKVWRLVVRWAMEDADIKDLKDNLYDPSLEYYKKAMPLAEQARRTPSEFSDPARIVSQNLDFMTRVAELFNNNQRQPDQNKKNSQGKKGRNGLGDFLSKAKAQPSGQNGLGQLLTGKSQQLGAKFLPIPMKGVGSSRITGGKQ